MKENVGRCSRQAPTRVEHILTGPVQGQPLLYVVKEHKMFTDFSAGNFIKQNDPPSPLSVTATCQTPLRNIVCVFTTKTLLQTLNIFVSTSNMTDSNNNNTTVRSDIFRVKTEDVLGSFHTDRQLKRRP